ncbi:MAG: alpha/beta hydrolase [Clostridia bacterium]|nr:alpha/beta hydrolase [Clostridia bacterium]
MIAKEFGTQNAKKILLVPGNMMSWRQFEQLIPLLETDFHVIAISTDGYDEISTFTTAEASAESVEKYIRERLDGAIDLAFGESFGCTTAGLLFHRQRVCVGALIMSGPQYMSLRCFNWLLKAIIPRNQFKLLNKIQEQKKLPWLLKRYTRTDDEKLIRQFSAVPKNISIETLRSCTDEALKLYKMIDRFEPDPNARVAVWHGAKEPNMAKAIRKLKRAFPNAEDHPFEGYGHGEIIANPDVMAAEIRRFMKA